MKRIFLMIVVTLLLFTLSGCWGFFRHGGPYHGYQHHHGYYQGNYPLWNEKPETIPMNR